MADLSAKDLEALRARSLERHFREITGAQGVGDVQATLDLAAALRSEGFLVPAIHYPTVAKGAARLRNHSDCGTPKCADQKPCARRSSGEDMSENSIPLKTVLESASIFRW